jgi:hypothetical protein
MSISAIAFAGLQRAEADLERIPRQVSNPPVPLDAISLSGEAVAILEARQQFDVSVGALAVAEQIDNSAL